ncbi:unnamed protein product [Fraxinus pennsylvanica]|uniref:Uncharacterized protein n=1 Tax=Fraxinus pennsylvanica TaxID=56036 RepID=A0AAD2AL92_9LAMI|nr:unnamed protein product [Fraxinus pennsylvanica]
MNSGSYTSNSTYKRNLDALLSSVSPNISASGFYNASMGEDSDRVNIIALCRADLRPSQCSNYVGNATAEIVNKCRGQRQAILWHEFCMVRYSDEAIFGTLATVPNQGARSGTKVTNTDVFYRELNILLDGLRDRAANNSSPMKFAANTRAVDDSTIYAFSQCTPDITSAECGDCLAKSAQKVGKCCVRVKVELESLCLVAIFVTKAFRSTTIRWLERYCSHQRRQCHRHLSRRVREISTIECLQYDLRTIRAATDNFSDANKLGQGGFGVVYKGKLPEGNEIAVKRLSPGSGQGDLEFKNEVRLLAKLQHRNLVSLLGFSVEGNERLLIYEWVQNGSLDRFICDVYSFGVLILEIISGQKVRNFQNEESMDSLTSFVWKNWHQGTATNIIDPTLRTSSGSMPDIMKCINIGLLCVQKNAADRPKMGSVVLMLSSLSLTLPEPSQPAFFMSGSFRLDNSSKDQSDYTTHLSTNEASISELYPR